MLDIGGGVRHETLPLDGEFPQTIAEGGGQGHLGLAD